MGASTCPRPLASVNHPAERHYTAQLPGSGICEHAESEAEAALGELAKARGTPEAASSWMSRASARICNSVTQAAVARITRDRPEDTCMHGNHGLWTLAAAESTWALAVRGCLRRCARCSRCRFLTVAPAHSLCMWHHTCDNAANDAAGDTANETMACGFRSGQVMAGHKLHSPPKSLALIFFGKFSGSTGRSSLMAATDNASLELIVRTHTYWMTNLLTANPGVLCDVFAHSWSPEVADAFSAVWGPLLVRSLHEPTMLADSTTSQLAIQCLQSAKNCERTASQLLSVQKAVSLRSEHELVTALRYDLTIVARNDLCVLSPYALPPGLWDVGTHDLWVPINCVSPSTCSVTDGRALPRGCVASGRGCFSQADGHNYAPYRKAGVHLLASDWVFAGGSESTSRMADAALRFHELVDVEVRQSGDQYVSTHFMWPYHAATSGLRLRWGLQLNLRLARSTEATEGGARPASPPCFDNETRVEITGRYTGSLLPGMEEACPYEHVLVCTGPDSHAANRVCSASAY